MGSQMHRLEQGMKLWFYWGYLTLGTKPQYDTNVPELWNLYEVEINIIGACVSYKRLFTLHL
jgi:hypothetical protein